MLPSSGARSLLRIRSIGARAGNPRLVRMDAEEHRLSSDEREEVETLLDALESVHDHSVLCPNLDVPVEDIMRDVLQDPRS